MNILLTELLEENANDIDYKICLTPVATWEPVQEVLFVEIFELLRLTIEYGALEYVDNI